MSRYRDFAQLVRLPNLPSAPADVILGALAAGALADHPVAVTFLVLASACLYCGGMVWNDYFDQDQDRRERPTRPLPSGRVAARTAAVFGAILLGCGLLFALLAGMTQAAGGGSMRLPLFIGLALIGCVLLYDGWLKRTWLGPAAMGACRSLNILLGVSASGALAWPRGGHLALVVGLYVAGVTWLARTEARTSSRRALRGAALVMLVALILALPLATNPGAELHPSMLFPYLLVALGFAVGLPVQSAIKSPTPGNVQFAVGRALFCLIVLDAVLASAFVGAAGLLLLLLLIPTALLRRQRWLYAT
jgi:4-hydroxybenzoate polyprenyltransferase